MDILGEYMKRKFLHIVIGIMAIIGTCSSVMAAEENEAPSKMVMTAETLNEKTTTEEIQEIEEGQETEKIEQPKETGSVVEEVKVSTGEKVVEYAKQFIGTPYVSGGNDLNKGVDCSGFTRQVYKNFGVNLKRRSSEQYAHNGYAVSKEDLKPGDLVFYGYDSVCHVAIYVGDGQVIHAPVPGKSVCIVPLWQRGDAPIVGYKRIFND